MAMGRPMKWAISGLNEPIILAKESRRLSSATRGVAGGWGTLVLSVGGVCWFVSKAQREGRINWTRVSRMIGG